MKLLTCLLILLVAFQGCKEKTEKIISETSIVSEAQFAVKLLSPQEFEAKVGKDSLFQLLDVRTAEEFNEGHLKFAENYNINNEDFQEKVSVLQKNDPVYVYCKSGGRSAKAAKVLIDLGFKQVYDLQGGITAWQAAALPIVK